MPTGRTVEGSIPLFSATYAVVVLVNHRIMEDGGRVGDPRLFGKQEPIKLGWLRLLLLPQSNMVFEALR